MALVIGPQLRTIRLHRRISQFRVAVRAGLRPDRVSLIERGVAASDDERGRLAIALDVPLEALSDLRVAAAIEAVVADESTSVAPPVTTKTCAPADREDRRQTGEQQIGNSR